MFNVTILLVLLSVFVIIKVIEIIYIKYGNASLI